MHRKTLFTFAALSAVCLLPMAGASAQDSNANVMSGRGTLMDAGMFRDRLTEVRDLFNQIQENHRLALAAADPLVQSTYTNSNRRLLNDALGLLNEISGVWESAPLVDTSRATTERLGTADAIRYANESDDTAFVRTTLWELRNRLTADKLNGRDPLITNQMSDMLDAAITRAENPNFQVAQAFDASRLGRIEWSRTETSDVASAPEAAPAPVVEETTVVETTRPSGELTEVQRRTAMERENIHPELYNRTDEDTYVETSERMGAASLPQTGGDPGLLVMFGSGLAGLGALLRRRSR